MTNMTQASLLIEIANGLATLTLNRPEVHNAFDDELIQNITTALKKIEQRNDVQIVVLTSQGKHFSAGADLNWMKRMATLTEQQNKDDAQQLAELMHTLNHLSKPTLALVNGAAYGGAIGLIACCDIALATQRSQFCLSEVKIGLSPAVISPYVIAAIGSRQARRYFLSAEAFDANQAHQIGLIHDVVADEAQLKNSSQQLIKTLLKNCPQAMAKTKQLIKTVNSGECDQAMRDYTVNLIASIRVSAEGQEGLTSFLEKRTANWVNDYE
ncbi:enoyl-CoA hydratase-related protein [Oceaniserpentilla sp. 4NH20-0058]|uniref:enoyl-CoA hydratase/isomerase family protein n=1 Tax=Oceaniserpentilla sp. 4NH20-0058 TaxID=3127660 RepID=UPI003105DC6C